MAKEIGSWGKPSKLAADKPRASGWADDSLAVITPLLAPGETLLWHARGRGPYLHPGYILQLVFLFGLAVFVGLPMVRVITGQAPGSVIDVIGCVFFLSVDAFIAWFALRSILAPSLDRYGLTNRRLIIVERYFPFNVRRFTPEHIDFLDVRENAGRGEIRFRRGSSGSANRIPALYGVDRPHEIAELIRATLRPDLEINKRKSDLYIPPLAPRLPPNGRPD